MNVITVEEAQRRHREVGAVMLDVREEHEWAGGHVEDAVHLPLSRFATGEFDPDTTYLMMCRSGARSAQATMALANAGYTAANVDGGMLAWAAAGLPMVSENGQPPHVVS